MVLENQPQVNQTKKLPEFLTTVTPFSKTLALLMLILFPIIGFILGINYQKSVTVDCNDQIPEIVQSSVAPSPPESTTPTLSIVPHPPKTAYVAELTEQQKRKSA